MSQFTMPKAPAALKVKSVKALKNIALKVKPTKTTASAKKKAVVKSTLKKFV